MPPAGGKKASRRSRTARSEENQASAQAAGSDKKSMTGAQRQRNESRDYHVGNLDHLLVKEGTRLLRQEGLHELSLRKVARAAGVSHTAAYRHYDDKNALLAAIARDGFHRLHEYQARAIIASGTDFNLRFLNLGWTYVKFALENPEYARIMFGGAGLNFKDYPALALASRKSYKELLMSVRLCQRNGLIEKGNSKQKALAAWSIVHGLAMLLLDGQFPAPPMDAGAGGSDKTETRMETLVKGIIVNLYHGLR